jgi:hypothetical protein
MLLLTLSSPLPWEHMTNRIKSMIPNGITGLERVNHNYILVIRTSLCRWSAYWLKHDGENIVNKIHHRILKVHFVGYLHISGPDQCTKNGIN